MTFSASVPASSDSPSLFPAQNQTNMARLKTIIEADHQFNLTATGNDGYHNLIRMTEQAPSGTLASTGRMYAKTSASRVHAHYMDDQATEYQMTPTMPIRAAVSFEGKGAVGNQTLRGSYNVASVEREGTGRYKVVFSTPMPNNDYIVQLTGMRSDLLAVVICSVRSNSTINTSLDTDYVLIDTKSPSNSYVNVNVGFVTIFSVT